MFRAIGWEFVESPSYGNLPRLRLSDIRFFIVVSFHFSASSLSYPLSFENIREPRKGCQTRSIRRGRVARGAPQRHHIAARQIFLGLSIAPRLMFALVSGTLALSVLRCFADNYMRD